MSEAKPLNPTLYNNLEAFYGAGEVETVSPGEAIQWEMVRVRVPGKEKPIMERRLLYSGEEYRVRCKACNDHRPRLHFNHRWGIWDEETGSRNLWLAHCFNEECYSDSAAQNHLFWTIYSSLQSRRRTLKVAEGKVLTSTELTEIRPPGPLWRLDRLQKSQPDHPAVVYLQGRGFDPDLLGRVWGVSYCPESRYNLASNRIIIPIYANKIMVGWQARYIGDSVNGVPFNKARVPKFWTSPGFQRRLAAYNLERALTYPTLVLVEGPTDTWRGGMMYSGLFGKTLSHILAKKIVKAMAKHGDKALVAVLLDPKQDPREKKRGKMHHIDKVVKDLYSGMRRRVVPVYLPDEDMDPGSVEREFQWDVIRQAASKRKFKVYFEKQ